MSRWFRHYAGMMRDEKLVRAALASKQPVERVLWVWGAILESAAEVNDGGRFDFDPAEAAYFLRTDEADVCAVLNGLTAMQRVAGDRVVNWSSRQFESDKSASRQAAYRKRQQERHCDDQQEIGDGGVTAESRHGDAPETETEANTDTEQKEKEDRPKREARVRTSYSEEFEKRFWEPYPRTPIMSKKEAFSAWQKLSDDDRDKASGAISAYKSFLSGKPDHPAVHACRFLSQRRFEGFASTAPPAGPSAPVWMKPPQGWKPSIVEGSHGAVSETSVRPDTAGQVAGANLAPKLQLSG